MCPSVCVGAEHDNFAREFEMRGGAIVRKDFDLPFHVKEILQLLQELGHQAFVVGGAVRDLLLGREPADYDVATSATPDKVLRIFALWGVEPTGIQYGTVTVPVTGTDGVQITSFRADLGESDGRRPEVVRFSQDIFEDAQRRDSTMNALYYDGAHVFDPVDGLQDIASCAVRAVGAASIRVGEDKLRAFRYIRQAAELGFQVDGAIFFALHVGRKDIWKKVEAEAAFSELTKTLVAKDAVRGLRMLQELGAFERWIPELALQVELDQKNPHHNRTLWEHTLHTVESTLPRPALRWAALLHDVGKPATMSIDDQGIGHFYHHHVEGSNLATKILEWLRAPKLLQQKVASLVLEHMSRYPKLRGGQGSRAVKKLIRRVGEDNIEDLLDLMVADAVSSRPPFRLAPIFELKDEIDRILAEGEPITVKDLAIGGNDLMELGMKPGPEMGQTLRELLEMVLERPDLNTREGLIYALGSRV